MVQRIRAHDWTVTPLGTSEGWAQSFKTAVDLVLSHGFPMMLLWGPERICIYNDAFRPLLRDMHPALLGRPLYAAWPELREAREPHLLRAWSGETVTIEDAQHGIAGHRQPDDLRFGETICPLHDEAGKIYGLLVTAFDTRGQSSVEPPRDRVSAKIEESEEWLRSAAEVGKLGLWDWNVRTGKVQWSDEHFRMEGYKVGELAPSYEAWSTRLHPEDREATEEALRRAMQTREEYVREFRVVHPDGSVHWLHGRGRFFYDEQGRPTRMIGAMVETTERREWEERQKVLVAELQHRTLNLVAVIRSIAEKTLRASAGLPDFRERFRTRLDALARVQGLLSKLNEHDRVTFDQLVRTELEAMDERSVRVMLKGPSGVRLRSSIVQTLAMALHELATNAAKYGALAQPQAKLAVTWSLEQDDNEPWLHVDWRETDVVMPPGDIAPGGGGQGRELIGRALPYQLGARTSFELGPDGVRCTISLPISASTGEVERG